MASSHHMIIFAMDFPEQLSKLRKNKGITQKALADAVGVHITQIQRYENGSTQPTLDIIRKLSTTLAVSADTLIFGEGERGPEEGLLLQFEAIKQFDEEDKLIAKGVLEGLILKHQAKQSLQRLHSKK